MSYKLLLLLHLLGATIWTGGHLVLVGAVLPQVLRNKDLDYLLRFEGGYERVGMPALVLQVVTGLWMITLMVPDLGLMLDYAMELPFRYYWYKLGLLALIVCLALSARFRVIPHLEAGEKRYLPQMAAHMIAVTIASVAFVIVGVGLRFGGLW